MLQYVELAQNIERNGNTRDDRTGTGTISLFGQQMRFNLAEGFPLDSSKFVPFRLVAEELFWMLRGSTNNNELVDKNVHIWDKWATPSGDLGPIYGAQWRRWPKLVTKTETEPWNVKTMIQVCLNRGRTDLVRKLLDGDVTAYPLIEELGLPMVNTVTRTEIEYVDQIAELIKGLKEKPFSRRHIVTAWNPSVMPDESISGIENALIGNAALASCHAFFQFYVQRRTFKEMYYEIGHEKWVDIFQKLHDDEEAKDLPVSTLDNKVAMMDYLGRLGYKTHKLDCVLYQRSADYVLGVPFNIASYAMLTMMVAQCVGMVAGEFIHNFGDSHIYANHRVEFKKQCAEFFDNAKTEGIPPLPKLYINPDKTDIFSFNIDDFELVGYSHGPKRSYDIAV